MKKETKINNIERIAIIALGLLIAVFSIVSPYQSQVVKEDAEIAQSADIDNQSNEEQGSDDGLTVKSLDAVTNALQVSGLSSFAGYVSHFDFEALNSQSYRPKWINSNTSKFFKTLFRYIISPNAP